MGPTLLLQRAALAPGVRCQCSRLPSGLADSPRPAARKPPLSSRPRDPGLLFLAAAVPQHQPPQPHPPPTQPSFPCSFCPSCQPPSPSAAACQLPGGFLAVEPPTPRPIHQTPIARPLIAWVILVRRARWFDRRRAVQPAFSIPRHTDESCCMAPRQPTHPYPPPPSVTVPCSCARVQHFPGLPLPCSLLPWTAPILQYATGKCSARPALAWQPGCVQLNSSRSVLSIVASCQPLASDERLKVSVWPAAVRQTSRRSTCVCLRANPCRSILLDRYQTELTPQADIKLTGY
ncbi:hypothetical protein VTN96DRAFT_8274 [Rasamsonia emersonii]